MVPTEVPIKLIACDSVKYLGVVGIIHSKVEHIGAIAIEIRATSDGEGFNDMVVRACVIAVRDDRPLVVIACCDVFLMIEFLMELEVQTVFDVASALWVGKDGVCVGVLSVDSSCFVPEIGGGTVIWVTFVLVLDRGHLVRAYRQYEFFY